MKYLQVYQWTTVIWFTSNTLPDFQLNIANIGIYYLYFFNKSHLSMSKGLKKKYKFTRATIVVKEMRAGHRH